MVEQLNRVIGENLKRLRAEQGLSLDGLAKESGVSRSRLGQIERGEANPSISTVWQIARVLRVEFSALVASPQTGSVVVSRDRIAPITEDDGRCRTYALFPFDPELGFETYISQIDPGGHLHAEPHPEGTHETITVVAGTLSITIDGVEQQLGTGDAMRFSADAVHEYWNHGDRQTEFSMLVSYRRAD